MMGSSGRFRTVCWKYIATQIGSVSLKIQSLNGTIASTFSDKMSSWTYPFSALSSRSKSTHAPALMGWSARYISLRRRKVSNCYFYYNILLYLGRLNNEFIGMPLVVKKNKVLKGVNSETEPEEQTTIIHEVKRVGLLIDRYIDLELRVGDHLVLYISKSQAWSIYKKTIIIK